MNFEIELTVALGVEHTEELITILRSEGGMEIPDVIYEKLYDYFAPEMPYGTMTGDDGDPFEWIWDRLSQYS